MKDTPASKYGFGSGDILVPEELERALVGVETLASREVLLRCFSLMDLTTLHTQDTVSSVAELVRKMGSLPEGYPMPASVCVYPHFASVVRENRPSPELGVTVVSACFPSSQSFREVKLLECRMAVRAGADEVDVVLPLNLFCAGDYEGASSEITAIRNAVDEEGRASGRNVVLKVILETGILSSAAGIAEASFLAMEAGADFIKTSTGKVEVNATPAAAFTMCRCIRAFYEKTGRKVGFKAAGGISSVKDALAYYSIVSTVLGTEWLDRKGFRLGVSRLGNALMSAVEGKTVTFF